jgi:hypothetical protein
VATRLHPVAAQDVEDAADLDGDFHLLEAAGADRSQ